MHKYLRPKAQFKGTYNGRRMYRVPVRIDMNSSRECRTVARVTMHVLAPTAAAAANWVKENTLYGGRPETEIRAYGPKGGEQYRYIGIWSCLENRPYRRAVNFLKGQMPLDLETTS